MDEVEDRKQKREKSRIACTKRIKQRKTHLEHWSNFVSVAEHPLWVERAKVAVSFVPEHARVLDFGCGAMTVEHLLPASCSYVPLDCAPRDHRTIVVDLNKQRMPQINADFVIALGVLEYLFDLPSVLRQLARQVPEGLISYHPLNETPARDRLSFGWVNALNEVELIALFKAAGYKMVVPHTYKPGLRFYQVNRVLPQS